MACVWYQMNRDNYRLLGFLELGNVRINRVVLFIFLKVPKWFTAELPGILHDVCAEIRFFAIESAEVVKPSASKCLKFLHLSEIAG